MHLQTCAEKRDCFAKHQPGVAGCGWLQPEAWCRMKSDRSLNTLSDRSHFILQLPSGRNFLST